MVDHVTVDLLKGEDAQAATNVKHLCLKCPYQVYTWRVPYSDQISCWCRDSVGQESV